MSSLNFCPLTCASRHGLSCWTSGPRAVSPVSWISRSSLTCPGRHHSQTWTLSSDICCCSVTRCLAPSQTEIRMYRSFGSYQEKWDLQCCYTPLQQYLLLMVEIFMRHLLGPCHNRNNKISKSPKISLVPLTWTVSPMSSIHWLFSLLEAAATISALFPS